MSDVPRRPEYGKLTLIHGGNQSRRAGPGEPGMESAARAAARAFESDLKKARRLRGFLSGRRTATFARELTGVLQDLRIDVKDTHTGIEIAAAFFRSDNFLFEECDDSSGSLGDVFRNEGRELFIHYAKECEQTASIIYRVLLESILAQAISKYYTHGVRYLLKIDKLAPAVTEWRAFDPHEIYAAQLRQTHARKSSFWTLYEGQRGRGSKRR